jgi:APA family basic amino acid/polyamine antiporter
MGTLAAFILVSISLPILRKRYPDTKGFSVPFGPYIIPALAAISAFTMMVYLRIGSPTVGNTGIPVPWFGFIVWLLIGFVLYFLYGRGHSTVGIDEAKEAIQPPA